MLIAINTFTFTLCGSRRNIYKVSMYRNQCNFILSQFSFSFWFFFSLQFRYFCFSLSFALSFFFTIRFGLKLCYTFEFRLLWFWSGDTTSLFDMRNQLLHGFPLPFFPLRFTHFPTIHTNKCVYANSYIHVVYLIYIMGILWN